MIVAYHRRRRRHASGPPDKFDFAVSIIMLAIAGGALVAVIGMLAHWW